MFTNRTLSTNGTVTTPITNNLDIPNSLINKNDLANLSITSPTSSSNYNRINSQISNKENLNIIASNPLCNINNNIFNTNVNTHTNSNNTSINSSNSSNTNQARQISYEFNEEQETCMQLFDKWSPFEQTEFCENLLRRMCHFQHGHINNFLKPMLQRDFISSLPGIFYELNLFD
jgi:hypothetical protein